MDELFSPTDAQQAEDSEQPESPRALTKKAGRGRPSKATTQKSKKTTSSSQNGVSHSDKEDDPMQQDDDDDSGSEAEEDREDDDETQMDDAVDNLTGAESEDTSRAKAKQKSKPKAKPKSSVSFAKQKKATASKQLMPRRHAQGKKKREMRHVLGKTELQFLLRRVVGHQKRSDLLPMMRQCTRVYLRDLFYYAIIYADHDRMATVMPKHLLRAHEMMNRKNHRFYFDGNINKNHLSLKANLKPQSKRKPKDSALDPQD